MHIGLFKNHTIEFFSGDPNGYIFSLIRIAIVTLLVAGIDCSILANSITTNENDTAKISFKLGERLEYKMKYGWFTLGKASIDIDNKLTTINNNSCYQMRINARTAGLANLGADIDDHYYSQISTKTLKTIYSEKHVKDGKSDWDQWNQFDYDSMSVAVKVLDHKREDPNRNWTVDLTDDTYGVLSTYLSFRDEDWDKHILGDSTIQNVFYEKKLYTFGVEYGGVQYIKINGRNIKTHKLYPILPNSEDFYNKRLVSFWITADDNKYPILIHAKMKFGTVKVELISNNGRPIKKYKQ
jgi:hypothetical protein